MNFLLQWIRISFFNLLIVSFLGFLLRYKIAFSLPWLDQKNVLHSHSHFAFSGWVTQVLMVLLIYYLSRKLGDKIFARYRWILYANLSTSYGMLVSFIVQGYALYSIVFSTLSIVVSFFFAVYFWSDLNKIRGAIVSHLWFRWSLIFSVISAFGPFSLACQMMAKTASQDLYLASVYYYLHFQYNGWFLFAGIGLLADQFAGLEAMQRKLRKAFFLFCGACIPAYFLSVLWLPVAANIYYLLIAAVIAQLIGWALILDAVRKNMSFIKQQFSGFGNVLLILSAIAFTIKLILQTGSIHPGLSQLSYGFRPIIIGYLHLVLLGVTTIFVIGYILSLRLIRVSKVLTLGAAVFVAGVIINELLLMVQGVAALNYQAVPYIQIFLFGAAVILMLGLLIMFIGAMKRQAGDHVTPVS
ncbi:MAG TPA: hypothetical protein VGE58_02410 [Daejeonella sp.]